MSVTDAPQGAPSRVERIKTESRGLRGDLARELRDPATAGLSDEGAQLIKFHGSYQQDDRDLRRERKAAGLEPAYRFMVRSKIPGGVMTAAQYLAHDALADRHGDGTLRLTTRQGIQLYGVVKRDLRETIHALNRALVTTLGACGDVGRNVVCCPLPAAGTARAAALETARAISDHLLPRSRAYHEIFVEGELVAGGEPAPEELDDPVYGRAYLPRKFKVGIAFPDDNCTDVLANDLGFLAVEREGRLAGFTVLVGGGLGQTHGKEETFPRLAEPLGFAAPEEVIEVATAVVHVQRDHGNRADRRRARLKYLIAERGIGWFRAEVEARLGRPLAPAAPVEIPPHAGDDHLGWHDQGDGRWAYGLFVENGRVADADGFRLRTALREAAEALAPGVRITPQQNLLLVDLPAERRDALESILHAHGVLRPRSAVRVRSMACPAMPTCPLALTESERVFPGVVDALEGVLAELGLAGEPLTVRMTGCPNGCARPYTADLAFVGRSGDRYVVHAGGGGAGTRLASPVEGLVPLGELAASVRPLLVRWRDGRRPAERFGDWWARTGAGDAAAV